MNFQLEVVFDSSTQYTLVFFLIVQPWTVLMEGLIHKVIVDPCISDKNLCPIKVDDVQEADVVLVTHGAPDNMRDE